VVQLNPILLCRIDLICMGTTRRSEGRRRQCGTRLGTTSPVDIKSHIAWIVKVPYVKGAQQYERHNRRAPP